MIHQVYLVYPKANHFLNGRKCSKLHFSMVIIRSSTPTDSQPCLIRRCFRYKVINSLCRIRLTWLSQKPWYWGQMMRRCLKMLWWMLGISAMVWGVPFFLANDALDPQTLTLEPLQGLFKRFLQTTFWGPILFFEGVVKMGYVSLDRKTYLEH